MNNLVTLAVDIGGTGVKCALLDNAGKMIGDRSRVPTPPKPVGPAALLEALEIAVGALGPFDRVSVGFPGAVRSGRVITAPNLSTELWAGFDLQNTLAERWHKPVRVMNDADVQGFGAIRGKGLEMVLTLGTGAGTSLFFDGKILPHLELAHHPITSKHDYDAYIGRVALEKKGKKAWNKRVQKVIEVLRTVVNFDHLYLGGGNAKAVRFDLPPDITIVPNSDGLTGGIALWLAEEAQASAAAANGKLAPAATPVPPAAASPGTELRKTRTIATRKTAATAAASEPASGSEPTPTSSGTSSNQGS